MNQTFIPIEWVFQEFGTLAMQHFGISYMTRYELGIDKSAKTFYFLRGDADSLIEKVGFVHVLEPFIIRKLRARNLTLDSVLEFDQESKSDLLVPYGIFVKKGELYVSDNIDRIGGPLCGLYNGELYKKEDAERIKVGYLNNMRGAYPQRKLLSHN